MNTKTVHIWLVSIDDSLIANITQPIKSAFPYDIDIYPSIPQSTEKDNQATTVVLLLDNRTPGWEKQVITLKLNIPGIEIILLYMVGEYQSYPASKKSDEYILVPIMKNHPDVLIQIMQLVIGKQAKYLMAKSMADMAYQLTKAQTITEVMQITCKSIVEILDVDHSGFVQFDDDLNHGWAMAEFPGIGSTGSLIPVEGIPAEIKIVHEGKYYFSPDVRNDKLLGAVGDHLSGKGIKSILIIPVRVGDTITASFSLDAINSKTEFSSETIDLCLTLANHVGIAIKNIRRQEEIRFMRGAFDSILKIAQMSVEGGLRETLQSIVDLACQNLQVDIATLYTYEQDIDRFLIGVGSGHSEGSLAAPNNITRNSTLYRILNSSGYEKTEEAPNHPTFKGGFVEREKILSSFGMKIMNGKEAVGVLCINFHGPRPHHFRDEEIKTYLEFGNQAAVIIKNAQLKTQNKKKLLALEGLYSVGEDMLEYDMEKALKRIVDQALPVVGIEDQNIGISHIAVLHGNILDFLVASSPDTLDKLKENAKSINIYSKTTKIGIVGRAILEDKTLNIGDIKNDQRYSQYYIEYRPDLNSQITVLLRVFGRIFGTLTVESKERNAFSEEAKKNLEHLARHAETVLLNSRHFTFVKTLIDTGEKLTSSKRLSNVLQDISGMLKNLFGCDLVSIYTLSPENKISLPAIISGKKFHPEIAPDSNLLKMYPRGIPLGELHQKLVIPKLLERREPIFCERDAIHDLVLGAGNFVARERVEAAAAIPLKITHDHDDQIVGFLFLNFRRSRSFTNYERSEINIFGQYVAHAIEYYRQYDELLEVRGIIGGINVVSWMDDYSERWQKHARYHAVEIKSNANLLKQRLDKYINGEELDFNNCEEYLEKIKDFADQIRKNTIPPRSYKAGYRERQCRIDTILKKIIAQYKAQNKSGIQFKLNTSKGSTEIRADQEWLYYGFANLIDYSVESMKESPNKKLELDIISTYNRVKVKLTDTGLRTAPCESAVTSMSRVEKEEIFRFRLHTAKAIFALYDGIIECQEGEPGRIMFEVSFPSWSAN